MDYPFYVRRLAEVPASLLEELQRDAASRTYAKHPFFTEETRLEVSHVTPDFRVYPHFIKLLELLQEWLPEAEFRGADLQLLDEGAVIKEHSDICSFTPGLSYRTAHSHKVHVPLNAVDCEFAARRSRKLPPASYRMPVGGAYLYNDYVLHSVHNRGPKRLHLVMAYRDLQWTRREQLLKQLGYKTWQMYEDDNPV